MHLGSIYLIVQDFNKSIQFYEKLLEMPVSAQNMQRFAQFEFEGNNISIMNGYFDAMNPNLTVCKGEYIEEFDNLVAMAEAENTHKFVLNFWAENLEKERERIVQLGISDKLAKIKYVNNVKPYYYFQFTDPDGNIIEITGQYSPKKGEFDE
ncbi:VOC family protein [Acidilutibacter cellobiosedens]|uniref:VOC family protein n=1 Tax=Acidilutibacter cellobiosedens TaxID=2507161 RepID=A0A410QBY2_9FIRM|nr:VOC family protein [Acidilutibacter cellobiosedens]QAT61459.1 VOC family protein [Acidilutibacter cellobiosedens]